MQVVYSPAHLAHDITVETFMGLPIPANEVAERAEKIRTTLEADGGFAIVAPTEHGEGPIAAVHDPGGVSTMHPTVSGANLVTFRIGAAFMFFG